MTSETEFREKFEDRHIGPDAAQVRKMLEITGATSLDHLITETIPTDIRLKKPLAIPRGKTEYEFLQAFQKIASKNKNFKSFLGSGYYDTITPPVISRNILQNPGWYTAYTPYQAEIAQGRLEALVTFQTMIMDLTAMPIANASLLDESTAAAEAMALLFAARPPEKKQAKKFLVDQGVFTQTKEVLKSRAHPVGINLIFEEINNDSFSDPEVFGILLQYPDDHGALRDYTDLIDFAHQQKVLVGMATDLLALTLLTPPGEMGADVVVGSTQRFGVPMGFGGPHAAFFATREEYKRQIPGRIIGVSVDADGKTAYRMALQTREQHIRREKATSNICTAQVLPAVLSAMYAVYHGPEMLKKIAGRVHALTQLLDAGLSRLGIVQENKYFFDTLLVKAPSQKVKSVALNKEMNFLYIDDNHIGISLDETSTHNDVIEIIEIFTEAFSEKVQSMPTPGLSNAWPDAFKRTSPFLTHPVFNSHHAEHEMLRYLKKLENKDLSMTHSMIPLGSCTMKLNATAEMIPITWPAFSAMHPFTPSDQAVGYNEMIAELGKWLGEITGLPAVSFQPNSGAQGEFTGLLVIREFHRAKGESERKVALIPASAHGTNPASAVMAGMEVVIVQSDSLGKIDVDDLKRKAEMHGNRLSCLMVTYPSTHGVFEESISEICDVIHHQGGLVYMDGANMNAQVGLTSPAVIGADVCHLNLHKTFCIPHGGGGPGMGPICVTEKLKPFLPGHFNQHSESKQHIPAVSSAAFGSASILAISYAYIALMGGEGLTNATTIAILNANYLKDRLKKYFRILYSGQNNRCAHEFIVDCREFKSVGIEVEDIAKRLMDFGFHAPTVSFPVPGTLMIEPTESETPEELDRFCDAMIAIRKEIEEVETGNADKNDNVLKNAPHTAGAVTADTWSHPYSREKAAYPLPFIRENKFWPSVARVDNAYGDRNLICNCPAPEEYQ